MVNENESTIADKTGPTGPASPVKSPVEVPVLSKPVPKGVVAVFVGPDGHAVANAADFDYSGYGGFSLEEAQIIRVKDAIARKVAEAFASTEFTKHLDRYRLQEVLRQMQDRDGYKLHIIGIGHEPPDD
jgi:hypothetical protein